jgi:hypothetical protein
MYQGTPAVLAALSAGSRDRTAGKFALDALVAMIDSHPGTTLYYLREFGLGD